MSTNKSKRRSAKKHGEPPQTKPSFPTADAKAVTAWSAELYATASPPLVKNEGLKALAAQFGVQVPSNLR